MTEDSENVVNGLCDAIGIIHGYIPKRYWGYGEQACRDAIALLKEQEAVEPQLSISGMWYECPICHRHITKDRDNYCARCGRSLKWK